MNNVEGLKLVDLVNEEVLRGAGVDKSYKAIKEEGLFTRELLSNPVINYYTLDNELACHAEDQPEKIEAIKEMISQKYDARSIGLPGKLDSSGETGRNTITMGDLHQLNALEHENLKDYLIYNYYNPFRKNSGVNPKSLAKVILYDAGVALYVTATIHRPKLIPAAFLFGVFYVLDGNRRQAKNIAKGKIDALEKELGPYRLFKENLKNAEVKINYSNKVMKKVEELQTMFNDSPYYQFDYGRINAQLMSMRGLIFNGSNMDDWH